VLRLDRVESQVEASRFKESISEKVFIKFMNFRNLSMQSLKMTYTLNKKFGFAIPKRSVIQKSQKFPKNLQDQSDIPVLRFQNIFQEKVLGIF
jgi:hypothetical protein